MPTETDELVHDLMDVVSPFNIKDLAAEAGRELSMRKRVYDRRVADGKMSPKKADLQYALMEKTHKLLDVLAALESTRLPAAEPEDQATLDLPDPEPEAPS